MVRELFGVMAAQKAAGGFLVTSGRLTEEAKAFAEGKNITLIDGDRLGKFLRSGQKGQVPTAVDRGSVVDDGQAATRPGAGTANARGVADHVPSCPRCNQPMARRVARQGARSGQAFWGCSDYPRCRGTLAIDV